MVVQSNKNVPLYYISFHLNSQCYLVIIIRGISAPGKGKEVVDGINAINKRNIYQLMTNVKQQGFFFN